MGRKAANASEVLGMERRRNRLGYLQDLIADTACQVVMTLMGIINSASIVAISYHGACAQSFRRPELINGSWILKMSMGSRGFGF
jgi:hypothetical protein